MKGAFLGGSVVKNPPVTAGDTGSIPDPGRSHTLQSNQASVPQQLRLCSGVQKLQLWSTNAITTEALIL